MLKPICFTFLFLLAAAVVFGQSNLFVDTSYTEEEMVEAFFTDSDVEISNVNFTGHPLSRAFFDAGDTYLGINAGIFLATGSTLDAAQPAYANPQQLILQDGDDDLQNQLHVGAETYDAAVLEFDIIPSVDTICFYYLFGSEEYPEYVGSQFNDVFAFFISGGPEYDSLTNIATVPGTDPPLPVTINNLNATTNEAFYIPQYQPEDSADATDLAYDAYTTILPAKAYVSPGESYHIKIGIADVADEVFDSGVLIGIQSLGGDSLLTPVADVELSLTGSQLNIENESMFAKSFEWDFGDGTTSNERHPGTHEYADTGTYELKLTVETWCCSSTFTETIGVSSLIPVADFSITASEGCEGDSIQFNDLSTNDIDSWEWGFPGGTPAASSEQNPTVLYESAGTYDVNLTVTAASGQTATVERPEAVFIASRPEAAFEVVPSGLQVAFSNESSFADSYLWDFGDGNESTAANPVYEYENPGQYTVKLIALNECGQAIRQAELELVLSSTNAAFPEHLKIYPNPVTEELFIEPSGSGEFRLSIYSPTGQLIFERDELMGKQTIPVAELNAGIYLFEVAAEGGVQTIIIRKQ